MPAPESPPLGDLRFSAEETRPLGGLNPYSHHYQEIGERYLQHIKREARLAPHHRVLEIGCGTGRLAKPLIAYLSSGRYVGFDVNNYFVDYCRQTLSTPNAEFQRHDIQHDEFNSAGTIDPAEFRFPFEDEQFDLICALAVFNHFRLDWVLNYLDESARTLKPRGIFFATFILLNGFSIPRIIDRTEHPFCFEKQTETEWFEFADRPLWNVALPELPLRKACMANGLTIKEPLKIGAWCGGLQAMDGHDTVVAIKGVWGPGWNRSAQKSF